jgi:hypothetical protein
MPDHVETSPVSLEEYNAMDMGTRRQLWIDISDIDGEHLDAHMAQEKAREANVPKVGTEAPDFVADILGDNRERTGEQIRLSDLRGKPVAIAFGSYT